MKTPKCPYPDHKTTKSNDIYPSEVKVMFGQHTVLGSAWMCEHCAKQFFIVETFRNSKKNKEKNIGKKHGNS